MDIKTQLDLMNKLNCNKMENSYLRQVTIAMFVLLLTLLVMTNALAQEFIVGELKYSINDGNSVSVIGHVDGQNAKGELVIPGVITHNGITYSVTKIGKEAFGKCVPYGYYNMGLTNVTIPNSVTTIGDDAFCGCEGLTNITIPKSVTSIGAGAFAGCTGLTNITIPYSVTSIGAGAFVGCTGLTNVTIPNSVTSIAVQAFEGCIGLTNVTIPNSVTSIGVLAFNRCEGLTNITIPNSVTTIENGAFADCDGLLNVTIPSSVTSIDGSFTGCSGLESIIVDSENKVYDSRNNCNAIIETSTNTLILGCKNTIIPQSVTSIGDYAFFGCSGLTSITIPSSVISIGIQAFWFCNNLTSVIIKSERIQDLPFYELFNFCDTLDETGVVYKISTSEKAETESDTEIEIEKHRVKWGLFVIIGTCVIVVLVALCLLVMNNAKRGKNKNHGKH